MSDFEEKLKRLEKLSDSIQKSDITLEDALKCFEEGIRLAKSMEKTLRDTEGRVEILMNGGEIAEQGGEARDEQMSDRDKKTVSTEQTLPPELGLFDETSEITGTRA